VTRPRSSSGAGGFHRRCCSTTETVELILLFQHPVSEMLKPHWFCFLFVVVESRNTQRAGAVTLVSCVCVCVCVSVCSHEQQSLDWRDQYGGLGPQAFTTNTPNTGSSADRLGLNIDPPPPSHTHTLKTFSGFELEVILTLTLDSCGLKTRIGTKEASRIFGGMLAVVCAG